MFLGSSAIADDDVRVRQHLESAYAHLVATEPVGLSDAQRAERARNVDRLRAYIDRGEYPRNYEVAGRRPHFIDEDGRICAVGYLIEQSAGRDVAEAINARHEWDFIHDIDGIETWVAQSGLSVDELARIQPSYGRRPRPVPDERTIQERIVYAALAAVEGDVQRCAHRFGMWSDGVSVEVSVGPRGAFTSVYDGSRAFQRCVRGEIEAELAMRLRGRRVVLPMTIDYSYAIDADEIVDPRFARPPSY